MKNIPSLIKKTLTGLFLSLHTTVICLILLCILVLWGTFFQIDNGIYAAKARFFNAWIVLIAGVVPFPGVRLAGLILILNALATLIFKQSWKLRNTGLILTHIGILVLLIGGGIVSYTARESSLTLWEGESSHESSSDNAWEIALWTKSHTGGSAGQQAVSFAVDTLSPGRPYNVPPARATFTIEKLHKNSMAFAASGHGESTGRMPAIDSIAEEPAGPDPTKNVPSAVVSMSCSSTGTRLPSRLFLYGANPEPSLFVNGTDTFCMAMRPKRIPLPLTITLLDFIKEDYAGTKTARQFKSKIRARAPDMDREVVIAMNRPFRYRQFTFYQSSYDQQGERGASTFAVVENRGKPLPYVAGILMTAGLLLHFLVRFFSHVRNRRAGDS
jgi:hypothetical protein